MIHASPRQRWFRKLPTYSLFLLFSLSLAAHGQVLDYSTNIEIHKKDRIITKSFLIQINNREQNWLADIGISHSGQQKFELLSALILDKNGKKIRELKKKELSTKSDRSINTFYTDQVSEEFSLLWNEFPYQIQYLYRLIDSEFLHLTWWVPTVFVNVPTISASLKLDLPPDYEVGLDFSDRFSYRTKNWNERVLHEWKIHNFQVLESDLFAPHINEKIPYVSAIAKQFHYGIEGRSETWSDFGDWIFNLNKNLDVLPIEEKKRIDILLGDSKNTEQVIKKLYHYLQDNTKYVNVSIDIGGMKPYSASYVCRNKFGDCKALTIYMKALLKHANIESFYTIVNSGDNASRINPGFPSQQFDHVILAVPMENDTVWLENTSNSLPYNYPGSFTQNRKALLVDSANSHLVTTPSLSKEDVHENCTYYFQLNENGTGRVSVSKKLKGKAFEKYLHLRKNESEQDQLEEIKKDLRVTNIKINTWDIIQDNRNDHHLHIEMDLDCSEQLRQIGNLKVPKVPFFKMPNFEHPSTRRDPVRINYPRNQTDSIIYDLPWSTKYSTELPDNVTIVSKFGEYHANFSIEKQKLITHRNFQLFSSNIDTSDYSAFYEFLKSVERAQKGAAVILKEEK